MDDPGPSLTPATHESSITWTRRSMSHSSTALGRPGLRGWHIRVSVLRKNGLLWRLRTIPQHSLVCRRGRSTPKSLAADLLPWARSSLQWTRTTTIDRYGRLSPSREKRCEAFRARSQAKARTSSASRLQLGEGKSCPTRSCWWSALGHGATMAAASNTPLIFLPSDLILYGALLHEQNVLIKHSRSGCMRTEESAG